MKRQSSKPFLFLLAALFVVMSLPKISSEKVRGILFATMAPVWEGAQTVVSPKTESEVEVHRLQAEIQLLHNHLEQWQELYQHEHDLNIQMAEALDLDAIKRPKIDQILKPLLEAIPAKVIFRSPSSWNSSIWVNVGEADNQTLGKVVIAKNSPVVIGSSVVGILDYVGKHQSRVRLITDSGLAPAVRAARGGAKNRRVLEKITLLQHELQGLLPEHSALQAQIEQVKKSLRQEEESHYLAKGELRGTSQPLWRSQSSVLHGIGFNYDFADSEGPARDLRTGEPQGGQEKSLPIIEEDDLLITTGMDGVFPPGLRVAKVSQIELLKEGDYFYELRAVPTAGDLNELSLVFILPPQGYSFDDQPPYK